MATEVRTAIVISVDAKAVRPNVEVARRALADLKKEASGVGGNAAAGLSKQFDGATGAATRLRGVVGGLAGPLAALASVAGVVSLARSIALTADAFKGVDSRLKLATRSQQEYNTASAELFNISQRTRSDLSETINLYSRVAGSIRDLGGSQKDAIGVTEVINQSFKVSGASAASSAAGVQQLAQALASGVLRGDEFNSVMENSPRLARALADGLGVPVGALRAMAEQGELTAQKVVTALLSQKDVIDKEFKTLPVTIDQASTSIGNSLTRLATIIDNKLGISSSIAGALQNIANAIDGSVDKTVGAEKRLAALRAQQTDNARFDGEVRLTQTRIEQLTDTELKSYQARIQGAVDFAKAQRDIARQQAVDAQRAADANQQAAPGAIQARSPFEAARQQQERERQAADVTRLAAIAGAANREVGLYEDTLSRVQALLGQRTQAEQTAADNRIQVIVKAIEREKALLDKANDDLKTANDKRKAIADSFKETQSTINAGPATGQKPNVINAVDAIQRARDSLQRGTTQGSPADVQAALDDAEEARRVIEQLAQTGEVSKQFLTSLNQQAAEVADKAAGAQEKKATDEVEAIRAKLAALTAEGATKLGITLDSANLDEQIDQVLKAAQDKASKSPVTIPTVLGAPGEAAGGKTADGGVERRTLPKLATGGAVFGPGTGTSDSILARLSNGEFVVRAAAVKHYGAARIAALNAMALPRFAEGGLVDQVQLPSVSGAAAMGRDGAGGPTAVVNLQLGAETFSGSFDIDVAEHLARAVRAQAAKTGARYRG